MHTSAKGFTAGIDSAHYEVFEAGQILYFSAIQYQEMSGTGGLVGCRTNYRWSKNKEFMMPMVFVLSRTRIKTLKLCQSTPKRV